MKIKLCLLLSLILFCNIVFAEDTTQTPSQISIFQHARSGAKLYAPTAVLIGKEATFKVVSKPNTKVKFVVNYGALIEKEYLEQNTNENGVAVFNIKIINDEKLVGKSVAIDAYVYDESTNNYQKAVMQTATGTPSGSNRVYIADNNSEKGVMFAPMQSMNQVMMNYDYSDRSDYNPAVNQMYCDTTPVYIKNMRDAQDNVR